jgi:hypothetical protein
MESLRSGLDRLVGYLPSLLSGILILAIGTVIALLLRSGVTRLLHRVGFDRLLARHGLADKAGWSGSRGAGAAAFWLTMLVVVTQAARALELDTIANGLARILGYAPHFIAAVLIFGAALLFGDWVRDRMQRRTEETGVVERGRSSLAPGFVRAAILTLGAFMALRELRIAPEILIIGFTLVLGAIAVAAALAFGLGSRHVAGRVTQDWYERKADGLDRTPGLRDRDDTAPRPPPAH